MGGSTFNQKSNSLHGIFSSKYNIGRGSSYGKPVDWPEMMKDTSLAGFSMKARDRRNQRTLNRIADSEVKLRAQLRMLRKDITNNVLEQHKTAGNSNLKVKATIGELIDCESSLLEMDKKIDKL